MKLESRIERLENEMNILKNEIQRTLLDIQEQILVHYYPALRPEDHEDAESMASLAETLRSTRRSRAPTEAFTDSVELDEVSLGEGGPTSSKGDSLLPLHEGAHLSQAGWRHRVPGKDELEGVEEDEDLEDDAANENGNTTVMPAAKEMSLAEIRRAHRTEAPSAHSGSIPSAGEPILRVNFAVLADWVNSSVEKVGKEQVSKAVETYASGGYLADETRSVLVRLIALAEVHEPVESADVSDTIDILMGLDALVNTDR